MMKSMMERKIRNVIKFDIKSSIKGLQREDFNGSDISLVLKIFIMIRVAK